MSEACVVSLSEKQFEQEVLRDQGTVLVDFYTTSCPPCRQVAPVLEQVCAENRSRLKIVKIDASENAQVAAAHRISAVPTCVLYHGGRKIAQMSGYQSKLQFEKWIASSLEEG